MLKLKIQLYFIFVQGWQTLNLQHFRFSMFSFLLYKRKKRCRVGELAKDWNKHNFFSYPEMVFLLLLRLSSHLLALMPLLLLTISYMSIQLDVRKPCFCSILWLQCISFQKGMLFDVSCLLITKERVEDFNQCWCKTTEMLLDGIRITITSLYVFNDANLQTIYICIKV